MRSRQLSQRDFIATFIKEYVQTLSESLKLEGCHLTKCQCIWLGFCLTGILLTNSINWSAYSRWSFGSYRVAALSWMFRKSKINFAKLFEKSIHQLLVVYNITEGALVIDDTERERSKNAKKLHALGKQKDKRSGGYYLGQNIIFLQLVTAKVSIPVGFCFYHNDPKWFAWKGKDEYLRKKGVPKRLRPIEVLRDYDTYPSKLTLAADLVDKFQKDFPHIKIKAVLGDCFYGSGDYVERISTIYPTTQIISQLKNNQKILINNEYVDIGDYFTNRKTGIHSRVIIRGGKQTTIYYSSTIAKVKAHGQKRLIIAYKYEGEQNYRYVFATDMSWRVHDVIQVYSLRWLVEVFIEDWKLYEGWANSTKHTGVEGSSSTLILSLLFDHCLLLHPQQKANIKHKLPASTVGSLRNRAQAEYFLQLIQTIIAKPNAKELLKRMSDNIQYAFPLAESSKHMNTRSIPLFEDQKAA